MILCIFVYIPKRSPPAVAAFEDYLFRAFGSQFHRLAIFGDFNIDLLSVSSARNCILNMMSSIGAIQTISAATRLDRILLDLAIISDPNRLVDSAVLPPISSSDHNALRVVLAAGGKKKAPDRRKIWLLQRAN